jgi:hypothetical protein
MTRRSHGHEPSHTDRRSYWRPSVDAFPATLVYLSIRVIAAEPDLWGRFHVDDRLLFRYEDLTEARSADVWAALKASSESLVRSLTAVVIRWLDGKPDALPSLEDALPASGSVQPLARDTAPVSAVRPNTWHSPPDPATSPGGRQPWRAPPASERRPAARRTTPTPARRRASGGPRLSRHATPEAAPRACSSGSGRR